MATDGASIDHGDHRPAAPLLTYRLQGDECRLGPHVLFSALRSPTRRFAA